ncbi:MAG: hypothetical protein Q7S99_16575 [Parvibaculum sp.]|mgnify:CR=1|nr:hypothetical protein [Parvibaculum sp.]|tara:strand:- start:151 stop:393 length:243 start_codon:yes stop_codon:yes gene_type:complete
MIRLFFITAISLALVGCAASVKEVSGPGGKTAYALGCAGMGRTKASCYEKAGEICPSGYVLYDDSAAAYGRNSMMLISCR